MNDARVWRDAAVGRRPDRPSATRTAGVAGVSFVLDKISYKVGEEVYIYEVSMSLEPGTMNVLLGPTLAGKTTLMRLMDGLARPSTGRLHAAGIDVGDRSHLVCVERAPGSAPIREFPAPTPGLRQ